MDKLWEFHVMKYSENEWTIITIYHNREESHQKKKKLKWEKVSNVCFRRTHRAGKINKSKELINTQLGPMVNWQGG